MTRRCLLTLSIWLALSPLDVPAADWPQWRGPNRDGTAPDFAVPKQWPEKLTQRWQITVGEGHSSPVVGGGRVYQFARQGDDEVLLCLDFQSGKEVWRSSYAAPYEVNPAATGHGKGPKSTPAFGGGKVVTFGISGILSCFDAETGKLAWRQEFARRFPQTSPLYGTAMSPLIVDGRCIAHIGGHDKGALTSFDLNSGKIEWEFSGDGPGYASPILATLAGFSQLITQTQKHVVGVSPATGKLLWRVPFTTDYDQNSVTPILYKDLLIYSGYSQPIAATRLEKANTAVTIKEAWSNPDHSMYMSSPVLKGKLLFGMAQHQSGEIYCLDADTGKTVWKNKGRMGSNVALLDAGSVLVLLTTDSRLIVIKPSATGYEPIANFKVADTPTWAHPVLLGKRILVKDKTALTAWDVE